MPTSLTPIPDTILAMLNLVRPCACGDRQIVEYIARDADSLEPVVVHRSIDSMPGLYFVSQPEPSWPRPYGWHLRASRTAVELLDRLPPLADKIYQHFKGNRYQVLCVGYDTRTFDQMVVYRSTDHHDEMPWVRRYDIGTSSWVGVVERDGRTIQRFALLEGRDIEH